MRVSWSLCRGTIVGSWKAGLVELPRIFRSPNSLASTRVIASTAPFVVE
jgi:hypothetical protein